MGKRNLFNDYMDYKLSSNDFEERPSNDDGCLHYVLAALIILLFISNLFS